MRRGHSTATTSALVVAALATCGRMCSAQQEVPLRADPSTALRDYHGEVASADPLGKHISVLLVDATVREALATVAAHSGLRLTYSSDNLGLTKRISFANRDISVGAALHVILAQTGLHAVAMSGGAVVLAPDTAQLAPRPIVGAPATGSGRTVSGRVTQPDGAPVVGATLGLTGVRDTPTTGLDGQFTIRRVPAGTNVLWARRIGYGPSRVPITISERDTAVAVTLVPVATTLPSVTTTSVRTGYHQVGFDVRMRSGVGQFLTYDAIVALRAQTATDLLQRFRGISVGGRQPGLPPSDVWPTSPSTPDGGLQLESNCTAIAVDGVARGVLDSHDLDNLITPLEIAAIEAYPASEIPGAFGPNTGRRVLPVMIVGDQDLLPHQCALVVIWTRQRLGLPAQ